MYLNTVKAILYFQTWSGIVRIFLLVILFLCSNVSYSPNPVWWLWSVGGTPFCYSGKWDGPDWPNGDTIVQSFTFWSWSMCSTNQMVKLGSPKLQEPFSSTHYSVILKNNMATIHWSFLIRRSLTYPNSWKWWLLEWIHTNTGQDSELVCKGWGSGYTSGVELWLIVSQKLSSSWNLVHCHHGSDFSRHLTGLTLSCPHESLGSDLSAISLKLATGGCYLFFLRTV